MASESSIRHQIVLIDQELPKLLAAKRAAYQRYYPPTTKEAKGKIDMAEDEFNAALDRRLALKEELVEVLLGLEVDEAEPEPVAVDD